MTKFYEKPVGPATQFRAFSKPNEQGVSQTAQYGYCSEKSGVFCARAVAALLGAVNG